MESSQNYTVSKTANSGVDKSDENVVIITQAHDDYVSFVALGGILPDPNGIQMGIQWSAERFAKEVGVDRRTLYNWRKQIPDFWDRVNAKRRELNSKDRLSNVWNAVAIKAAAGDMNAAKIYLKNFDPNYIDPNDKVEQETLDGFTDAIEVITRRQQLERTNPIEAEVIDVDGQE